MRVFAKRILQEFWIKHNDCEEQLKAWYHEAEKSGWRKPAGIVTEYPKVSILQDNRVCFNIKEDTYRLIVKINYDYGMAWIRFVGTHADYDKIDANKI